MTLFHKAGSPPADAQRAVTIALATDVDLSGKLSSPSISTWEAIRQILHNAFIQAILPGFDRAIRPNVARNAQPPTGAHEGATPSISLLGK